MPIFESDEPLDSKEFRRKQKDLNDKVFRLEYREMVNADDRNGFDGGDCWEGDDENDGNERNS